MIMRYAALSAMSLTLLTAGILALAAPAPYQGPLLVPVAALSPLPGAVLLQQPIFLSDLVGLALLAAAVAATGVVALAWELRRRKLAG